MLSWGLLWEGLQPRCCCGRGLSPDCLSRRASGLRPLPQGFRKHDPFENRNALLRTRTGASARGEIAMNRSFAALVAALALLASSGSPDAAEYYLVESLATQSEEPATRAQARELRAIYEDLARVSGVEAQLVYSNDPDLNAFATEIDGEKIVLVQEGLLARSEEHTSELQSLAYLVCRLLLEKKK